MSNLFSLHTAHLITVSFFPFVWLKPHVDNICVTSQSKPELSGAVMDQQDVVVVGGGISGLAAARTLLNDDPEKYKVTVLEANPTRYGGRIHTKQIDTVEGDGGSEM